MDVLPSAFKRLMKDVREMMKNPLHDNKIYYRHDEENILKGYILIIGPEDTPYAYGNYLFEADYPYNYPTKPPKLRFLTNGENIRMNPNLYRDGKVCVSILNTWSGDQWSSCQTIKSVLITLLTLFTKTPLLNEPGINSNHPDVMSYNNIISNKNISIAICRVLNINNKFFEKYYTMFENEINENFIENYSKIIEFINNNSSVVDNVSIRLYGMRNIEINYNILKANIEELYLKLKIK